LTSPQEGECKTAPQGAGLWGGVFEGAADPLFRALNDSLAVDCRLLAQDVEGSRAWAAAIAGAGVITDAERRKIDEALVDIAAEHAADPSAIAAAVDEDVHSFVERELTERLGALGRKLHTGRSRNDQVATDLRLWTRSMIGHRLEEIRNVQRSLVELARRQGMLVIPGYTHLQRAQPVLLGHWCLAYFEMFSRDAGRLENAAERLNECPLGCGALAGTTWPVDRAELAQALGFARPCANSLDAVSDRDFVFEVLSCGALCSIHLSRFAEDLIFYATGEAAFVRLADAVTSGSSLMPQKKNPDALELLRGKAGAMIGALTQVGVMLKGLPLAYNKDLQEDKAPLFRMADELSICLRLAAIVLDTLKFDAARCRDAARGGHANATELADHLVARGVPFREAHETAGRAVRAAIARGVSLEELSLDQLREIDSRIDASVFDDLSLEALLARRSVAGGTSPACVTIAIESAARQVMPSSI